MFEFRFSIVRNVISVSNVKYPGQSFQLSKIVSIVKIVQNCPKYVRLSPLAEVFRSGGSPTEVKIPQTWTFLFYRGVATINLLPQNITILSVPWDAGVGETAASGFPSFLFYTTTSNSRSSRLIIPITTAS